MVKYNARFVYLSRYEINRMKENGVNIPSNKVIVSPLIQRDIQSMLTYISELEEELTSVNLELRLANTSHN